MLPALKPPAMLLLPSIVDNAPDSDLTDPSLTIALEPANTSYEVRILPPNRVKIQGKLIGLYRKY